LTRQHSLKKLLDLFRPQPDPRLLPIGKPDEILAREGIPEWVGRIRHSIGISPELFDHLYLSAIRNAAMAVQLCPGSEAHHHAWPGGLIAHMLESCAHALDFRQGMILPVGSSPEEAATKADLYNYAVFAATLLHDVAKPLSDQKLTLYTRRGRYLCEWDPLSQDVDSIRGASYMRIEFRPDRVYSHHQQEALTFLQRILPVEGRRWLQSDKGVYSEFLDAFSSEPRGPIYKLMARGDRVSVSKALGAQQIPQFDAAGRPLWMKMRTALRHLAETGGLSLNRSGAAGWADERGVWMMSKRTVDAVREQLLKEGHTGVPGDNNRVYDILSESGLLVPNKAGKAIWRCRIASDGWSPEAVFSLILLTHDCISANPEDVALFDGQIEVVSEAEQGAEAATAADEAASIPRASPPVPARVPEKAASDIDVPLPMAADSPAPRPELPVPSRGEEAEGERFRTWIEKGINQGEITWNTRESFVHFIDEGVLLVSPLAWRKYALAARTGWEEAQKSFQSLKINLKNPDGGVNVWQVRVERRGKVSRLKGWVVPYAHFSLDEMPEPNPALTLIQPDAVDLARDSGQG